SVSSFLADLSSAICSRSSLHFSSAFWHEWRRDLYSVQTSVLKECPALICSSRCLYGARRTPIPLSRERVGTCAASGGFDERRASTKNCPALPAGFVILTSCVAFGLEVELQRQLALPGADGRVVDLAERGIANVGIWRPKDGMVEGVLRLDPQFQVHGFKSGGEGEDFADG